MISGNDITLSTLRALNPDAARFVDRLLYSTYAEFIDLLYADVDDCIVNMQNNRAVRQDDGEDRLTQDIVDWLKAKGYQVTHDGYVNGHADIVVEGKSGYLWLGEAKIHSSYPYLYKGFNQLCTRYSTAAKGQAEGGLIVYIKNKGALSVMKKWREHISEMSISGFSVKDCSRGNALCFETAHTHEASELPYKVRHIGVVLYHNPKA